MYIESFIDNVYWIHKRKIFYLNNVNIFKRKIHVLLFFIKMYSTTVKKYNGMDGVAKV